MGESRRQQEVHTQKTAPVARERWNFFYQTTSIGSYHGDFQSPYSGQNSLASIGTRCFADQRPCFSAFAWLKYTIIYFDPGVGGGPGV